VVGIDLILIQDGVSTRERDLAALDRNLSLHEDLVDEVRHGVQFYIELQDHLDSFARSADAFVAHRDLASKELLERMVNTKASVPV